MKRISESTGMMLLLIIGVLPLLADEDGGRNSPGEAYPSVQVDLIAPAPQTIVNDSFDISGELNVMIFETQHDFVMSDFKFMSLEIDCVVGRIPETMPSWDSATATETETSTATETETSTATETETSTATETENSTATETETSTETETLMDTWTDYVWETSTDGGIITVQGLIKNASVSRKGTYPESASWFVALTADELKLNGYPPETPFTLYITFTGEYRGPSVDTESSGTSGTELYPFYTHSYGPVNLPLYYIPTPAP